MCDLPLKEDNMKSHVSDYLEVMECIYLDAVHRSVAEVSYRDLDYIRSRVKTQGVSFLTITLPNFAADFEKSLELGYIDSKCFRSFRKHRAIPAFLQGMLSHVFDLETGRINDDVKAFNSPICISNLVDGIRQICLAFKKVELPCTPARTRKALENFIDIERSFDSFHLPQEDQDRFSLVSSMLWDSLMGNLCLDALVPRHGPGATADRISGNQKFYWRRWHKRLEPYFPVIDSCYPISIGELNYNSRELDSLLLVDGEQELPVRVTPVPKTLKGPRVIAIEPCCMQYAQQGIRSLLYEAIESHCLFSGHINFRDQSINQSLALTASSDGQLATIDLSDASDRVPRSLALQMFRGNPDLMDSIDACRSTHAQMPGGLLVGPLRKFASMGSALCFPVEAMYFYTICVIALLRDQNLPVSYENIKDISRSVYVYGDDLIVPSHCATTVLDHLKKYNCKVNDRKTFYRGSFRESCGVDAYLGIPVTPVYVGTAPPKNRRQASELISWVETGKQFYRKGFLRTSQLFFSKVEQVLGPLGFVADDCSALGRNHYWVSNVKKRYNRKYQRLEVRLWVPSPVYRTDKLDGYAALVKSLFLLSGVNPPALEDYDPEGLLFPRDPLHLERSALHGAVTIKRRWVSASLVGGAEW
jgi:hypothetical protein